jgi:hypothetical protein
VVLVLVLVALALALAEAGRVAGMNYGRSQPPAFIVVLFEHCHSRSEHPRRPQQAPCACCCWPLFHEGRACCMYFVMRA